MNEDLRIYENVSDIAEHIRDPRVLGGFVYVLDTDQGIKIGKSRAVARRVSEISHTSGKHIKRIAVTCATGNYADIEKRLHKQFKEFRILSEWYSVAFDTVIKSLKQQPFSALGTRTETPLEEEPLFSLLFDPLPDPQSFMEEMIKSEPAVQSYLKLHNLELMIIKARFI